MSHPVLASAFFRGRAMRGIPLLALSSMIHVALASPPPAAFGRLENSAAWFTAEDSSRRVEALGKDLHVDGWVFFGSDHKSGLGSLFHQPMRMKSTILKVLAEVSWDQAGRATDLGTSALQVTVGPPAGSGQPAIQLVGGEPVASKGAWEEVSRRFTATGEVMTLNFNHFIVESGNPDEGSESTLIDNVKIRKVTSP